MFTAHQYIFLHDSNGIKCRNIANNFLFQIKMLTFALAKMSAYAVLNLLLYFYVSVWLIFPEYIGGSQKQKNLVNELYFILAIMGEENFKEFKQHVHRAQYSIGQKGTDVSESGLFLLVKIGVLSLIQGCIHNHLNQP